MKAFKDSPQILSRFLADPGRFFSIKMRISGGGFKRFLRDSPPPPPLPRVPGKSPSKIDKDSDKITKESTSFLKTRIGGGGGGGREENKSRIPEWMGEEEREGGGGGRVSIFPIVSIFG